MRLVYILSGIFFVLLCGLSVWYHLNTVRTLKANFGTDYTGLRTTYEEILEEERAKNTQLTQEQNDLIASLDALRAERQSLADALAAEQQKVAAIEKDVGSALKTVATLDKLSKTDPQLLQKYSKVYFLNEHYAPRRMTLLDKAYTLDQNKEYYLHADALSFFNALMEDAREDGIDMVVASAFRSFDTQGSLKGAYTVTYGSGANTFSADQGYSEHQLGTTIDFTTKERGSLAGFENTPAYEWLTKNAYKYGFVLSYPKDNQYYIFEPWHWRFVGRDLARKLHREEKYFYDLDQREINEYLVSLFD